MLSSRWYVLIWPRQRFLLIISWLAPPLISTSCALSLEKHEYVNLGSDRGRANKKVIVNKSMSPTTPKVDAVVMFDEIGVVFDRDQYRDALSVVDVFHF